MSSVGNHIKMTRGDHQDLAVTLSWPDGDPVDLTDAELRFTVKEKLSDPQSAAKVTKANTLAGGDDTQIKILNATGGSFEIYIVPIDTEGMDPGTYQYDIEIIRADGHKNTPVRDKFTLRADATTS